MPDEQITIDTPDGPMGLFIARPGGAGPFGAAIMFMDVGGVGEALKQQARDLSAAANVVVALPDLYHRWGSDITFDLNFVFTPEGEDERKVMFGYLGRTTDDMFVADAEATLDFLDAQDYVGSGPRGAVGYCLGGRAVVRALAAFPDRIKAGSAVHPSELVQDNDESPHLGIARFAPDARLYFGYGSEDHMTPPPVIAAVREQLDKAGIAYEDDITEGAGHGFTMKSRPEIYDEEADRLHREKTTRLFVEL